MATPHPWNYPQDGLNPGWNKGRRNWDNPKRSFPRWDLFFSDFPDFSKGFSLFFFSPVQDLKGLGYEKGKPVGLVGVTELSEAQKKQLKEQQEVIPKNPHPKFPPVGMTKIFHP